jgi:hypothetical protein
MEQNETLNKCELKKLFEEKSEKLTFKCENNKSSNLWENFTPKYHLKMLINYFL